MCYIIFKTFVIEFVKFYDFITNGDDQLSIMPIIRNYHGAMKIRI